jgi:hypothetical protein
LRRSINIFIDPNGKVINPLLIPGYPDCRSRRKRADLGTPQDEPRSATVDFKHQLTDCLAGTTHVVLLSSI